MKTTTTSKILLFCFCFYFITIINATQEPKDTLVAYKQFRKADSLLKNKKYKESIIFFKKALSIYEKNESWEQVVDCYGKLGKNFEDSFNYNKALLFYEKKHKLVKEKLASDHKKIARSLSDLGSINSKLSKYKKALYFFEKELVINLKKFGENHQKTGNTYNNIGIVYHDIGELHKSLTYLNKSLNIDINILDENHLNIGFSYVNIGSIYFDLRQHQKALEYYQKALPYFIKNDFKYGITTVYNSTGNILKNQGKINKALKYYKKSLTLTLDNSNQKTPALSHIYMNIGSALSMLGEFDKASFYLNKSLEIYRSILGENHFDIIKVYDNLGLLHTSKGDYKSALKYHTKALNTAKNIFDANSLDIAYSLNLIGALKNKNEQYNDALFFFHEGLKIMKKNYKTESILLSKFYYDIGNIHYKKKEYNIALKYLDKALFSNSIKKTTNNTAINPNNYLDNQLLLKTLHTKAQVIKSEYNVTKSKNSLTQCNNIYNDIDKAIHYLRESYQDYNDKIYLAEQSKKIYTDAIITSLLNYRVTNKMKDLEQVFYFVEKSKSNILKDLITDANAKGYFTLPEEIIKLENTIKSDLAYYKSQIVTEQSKDSANVQHIKEYEDKLFNVNRRKDSLVQLLEKKYPKYYQLKHSKTPISIKEIQNKINEQTTLLEFFTTDNITYAFTITKNNATLKEIPLTGLSQKVATLNNAITAENNSEYKKMAHTLYKELLLPIKNNFIGDELIVIPDGPLWHLNFDLLLTEESATKNNRELSYLLKKYAISYTNAAQLLFNPIENKANTLKIREECLAFSFSDTTSNQEKTMSLAMLRNTGDDLPGTRKEIRAIANIIDGQYYYGSKANEATFKQNAGKYSMLHLALHGDVDNENPQNSKLYFTKNKDSIEDNLLYAHELFSLNIPADLVVLSACNTGTGKIANGEGLMSLGNAFQYAGAKSLLLSKWEVSDKTTPELMNLFYMNLKNGYNKAKALQQAKLTYLNTTGFSYTHPFYWGSFYVLGNTDPIAMSHNFNTIYLWGLGIFLCLFLFWILAKKKKIKNL